MRAILLARRLAVLLAVGRMTSTAFSGAGAAANGTPATVVADACVRWSSQSGRVLTTGPGPDVPARCLCRRSAPFVSRRVFVGVRPALSRV